jgi:1-acyl-sn-glycerol-3-phosphate acyltransferase
MFSRMRTISIDRDGGNDLAAMRESVRLLEEGSALVLFPEGSRSPDGTIQPAKRGVGLLASMAKVPIIPARIFGSYEAWGRGMSIPKFFSRIHVAFAAPLLPEEYLARCDGSNRHQFIVNLVMERISQIESSYIFR